MTFEAVSPVRRVSAGPLWSVEGSGIAEFGAAVAFAALAVTTLVTAASALESEELVAALAMPAARALLRRSPPKR